MRLVSLALLVALSQAPAERARGPAVDFIALQADGTPVPDLRATDVEIRIGDRVRMIRSLRRVTAAPLAPSAPRAPLAPPYGTNANVSSGRRFVLIVDQESFRAGRESQLRGAVEGLAAQMTPLDATLVAALPFGGIRLPFTKEAARVRRAIDGISGQASSNETGSEQACRTRRFLESLEGFLAERRTDAQPSTVIVFTGGMAAPRRDAAMAMAPGMCELVVDQFKRLTPLAGAARGNFYVVVPADIGMTGAAFREGIAGGGYRGSDNPLEGIEHFEGATGAIRVPLDATGTNSLARVVRESAAYYEAEIEPERGEVYGRVRAFSVKALRKDVTVRARPEIALRDPALRAAAATKLTVPDLLGSFEAMTDLPLRVAGFPVREPGGLIRVGVVVEAADPAATLSSVGALLITGDGRVAGRWFAKDASEHPLLGAIAAPAGTYTLRVAALDTAGRAGIAEDTVDASLVSVGPLTLGGLLLGLSRPEGVRLQLEFHAEPVALASFDIYGGTSGQRLGAALEVARAADGPPLVSIPLTLTRADESRVTATGAVPLGALQPGDYVVRGVIRLEDGTTGRVMRTLRKVAK
jgi:hypothetical protein